MTDCKLYTLADMVICRWLNCKLTRPCYDDHIHVKDTSLHTVMGFELLHLAVCTVWQSSIHTDHCICGQAGGCCHAGCHCCIDQCLITHSFLVCTLKNWEGHGVGDYTGITFLFPLLLPGSFTRTPRIPVRYLMALSVISTLWVRMLTLVWQARPHPPYITHAWIDVAYGWPGDKARDKRCVK